MFLFVFIAFLVIATIVTTFHTRLESSDKVFKFVLDASLLVATITLAIGTFGLFNKTAALSSATIDLVGEGRKASELADFHHQQEVSPILAIANLGVENIMRVTAKPGASQLLVPVSELSLAFQYPDNVELLDEYYMLGTLWNVGSGSALKIQLAFEVDGYGTHIVPLAPLISGGHFELNTIAKRARFGPYLKHGPKPDSFTLKISVSCENIYGSKQITFYRQEGPQYVEDIHPAKIASRDIDELLK